MNNDNKALKQYLVSPAAGKRIIARALLHIDSILDALKNRTVVIVAGTTNGYVAEEFLNKIGQASDFSKKSFFRGITLPLDRRDALSAQRDFPGDVVIVKGRWDKGKTIFDVAYSLQMGDVVIKGANAVNLYNMQAAIYIGNSALGTSRAVLEAAVGRRVELYLPVGLEKRVPGDINEIARRINSPNASGPRYLPVNGNVITELQAIKIITGAEAELVAGGGVCGAEGSCYIAVFGTPEQLEDADRLMESVGAEPNFEL